MTMKKKLSTVHEGCASERAELNDGVKQLAFIKDELTKIFMKAFQEANATNSIDEKMKLLGESAHSAINFVETHEASVLSQISTLDSKLEVLEDLIAHQEELELIALQDAESEDM